MKYLVTKDGNVMSDSIFTHINKSKTNYLYDHDLLTGLYNYRYFEAKKILYDQNAIVPISILIIDINGLKSINDVFGHKVGDHVILKTAKILQKCCRVGDVLARTGGDDFKIILPDTDSEMSYVIIKNIKDAFEKMNDKPSPHKKFSISIGFGTKVDKNDCLDQIERIAEEHLRTKKLFLENSHYFSLINSIMTTLYVRSKDTEEHSKRVYKTCEMIAIKMGLSANDLSDLHLFSMLHDIGKVGIDDRILNKHGSLSQDEWVIMKTHPEIGCQIVSSVPEFSGVSNMILSHHERWDGAGYPSGLSGTNIPLLSRILAVADSYDAMTENRIYRNALSKEEALEEIRKNAGTQFDPNVALAFLQIM